MKKLFAAVLAAVSFCAASTASATPIASSTYSLSALSGVFAFGRSDWNAYSEPGGVVNNTTQLAAVKGLLSDGYVEHNNQSLGFNGIYSGYPYGNNSMTFSFTGGADYLLDSLTFLSSRSYGTTTSIILQYVLDGGAWQTALSTTSGALGMLNTGSRSYTLNFGGVQADAFRLVLDGSQISFHELSVNGTAVPEPGTVTMLGLGLLGLVATRRKWAGKKG